MYATESTWVNMFLNGLIILSDRADVGLSYKSLYDSEYSEHSFKKSSFRRLSCRFLTCDLLYFLIVCFILVPRCQ
jgi:hypothetical protein